MALTVDLRDRVAVVTGAGRGLGREMALALGRAGAHVVAVSRTKEQVDDVARAIAAAGGSADAHRVDMSDADDVARLAKIVAARHGRVHVLVNNAALRMDHIGAGAGAYPYRLALVDVKIADWDRMMATNLRGVFLASKLLFPLLAAAGHASVVNVSAGAGLRGQAYRAPYSASKFALEGLTQAVAEEWRPSGIAVNTLEPGGSVLTDDVKAGLVAAGTTYRFLKPDVIVAPLLFLAGQDATGVTGTHVNAVEWALAHGLGPRERWYVS